MLDSTKRFSDRVSDYVKYRPAYPPSMIEFLVSRLESKRHGTCVDVGSGTGILTRELIPHFDKVVGVEPNDAMRQAAEALLAGNPRFVSASGTAERTGLESGAADLVTAAQAFHWFDKSRTKTEFMRILKDDGIVAIVWNDRLADTEFLAKYDELLKKYATDYNEVNHQNVTGEELGDFYGHDVERFDFPNSQDFDLGGVYGRLDSSSYAPKPGTREFDIIRKELARAFEACSISGKVSFNYRTELYVGALRASSSR